VAELPEIKPLSRRIYEGAVEAFSTAQCSKHAYGRAASAPASAPHALQLRGRDASQLLKLQPGMAMTPSSIAATAEGLRNGRTVRVQLLAPVTVRKDESAMLPFLQQAVTARKLLVYSGGGSEFPRNAGRDHQLDRQDPGWRPHHGLRWRRLRRRGAGSRP